MEKVAQNNVKGTTVEAKVAQANEHAATVDAAKLAQLKEKKKEAAKLWKERKDKEAAERVEAAKKLIKFLADKKVELPADLSAFLNGVANPTVRTVSGGSNSLFNKAFGAAPKVGDKVTLLDFMKNTLKSKAEFDRYIKIWAEKGIVIEFVPAKNMLESTYEIKQM